MKRKLQWLSVLLASLLMSGCATNMFTLTKVHGHDIIQHDLDQPHASVYFIRPAAEHVLGYADNTLPVEVDGSRVVSIGKGEYTLLYIKPRRMSVTTITRTQTRGRWEVEDIRRTREFDIQAGHEYYIVLEPFDGEFRGAEHIPKAVDLHQARKLIKPLKAHGLARNHPPGQ